MKILLVSYYFPPNNAIGAVRAGKFAKYLISQGHEVRVLTTSGTGLPQSLPVEIPEDQITYTRTIDLDRLPFKLLRTRTTQAWQDAGGESGIVGRLAKFYKTFVTIPDGQIGWLPFALREGRRILSRWRPDLIFASAMPFTSLLIAHRLSRKFETPWVAELRDLWVDSHYYEQPRWRRFFEDRLERAALSSARALVTVSEPLAQTLRRKYGKPTAVVLNGFDPEDYSVTAQPRRGPADRVHILYTGLIYPGRRDPSPLFEALRRLGSKKRHFLVSFYGRRLPTVTGLAKQYGVTDVVESNEPVSYKDITQLQLGADVLLLLLWDSPAEHGVFTGKLFEYLGARRPILSLGLGTGVAAELIRERKAGLVSNDPERIAEQLRAWLREKQETGKVAALPESVTANLSRDEQFAHLQSFLKSISAAPDVPKSFDRLRVLHVITGLRSGGAERMLTSLVTSPWPAPIEFRVVSLTRGGRFGPRLREAGIAVESLNMRNPLSAPRELLRLVGTIRRFRPHVVQSWMYHADLAATLALLLSGRRRRTRLYWGIRCSNMDPRQYAPLLRRVIRINSWLSPMPDKIIANSESGLRYHAGIGYRAQAGIVIDNGVNTVAFRPDRTARSQVRNELGVTNGVPIIAMVARNDPMKDHRTFFAALERVPDAVGLLIGAGTERFPDNPRIKKIGETGDVPRMLAACDLIVSSSAYGEGFSNALLEGMSCGLPAVATDVGDARRIIGDAGLVVPPRDVEALARAMNTLLAEPEDAKRQRRDRVRERILKNYTLQRTVDRFQQLYVEAR